MRYHASNTNHANALSVVSKETRRMLKLSGIKQFLVHAGGFNLVNENTGFAKKKIEKRIQFLRDIKLLQE
jgi:hypothetical protein